MPTEKQRDHLFINRGQRNVLHEVAKSPNPSRALVYRAMRALVRVNCKMRRS